MSLKNTLRHFHQGLSLNSQPIRSPFKYLSDFLQWHKKKNFGKYSVVRPSHVCERKQSIPPHIPKPSYFLSGIPSPVTFNQPEVKDEAAIIGMRHACRLAQSILKEIGKEVQVGRTTEHLDAIGHELIISANAYPSPLNYRGFPKSICTSVNNVVCHGIPDSRPLEDGDIVNIDITVYYRGYHGDCSKTFLVGNVDEHGQKLVEVTETCLSNAIAICKPNVPFNMIGKVIEETARSNGLTVLPAVLGHGIGSYFHGPPEVHHANNCYGGLMTPGNTFTIEPAVTQGGMQLEILEDGWTVVTSDEARSAQSEHTILITESGVEVLT